MASKRIRRELKSEGASQCLSLFGSRLTGATHQGDMCLGPFLPGAGNLAVTFPLTPVPPMNLNPGRVAPRLPFGCLSPTGGALGMTRPTLLIGFRGSTCEFFFEEFSSRGRGPGERRGPREWVHPPEREMRPWRLKTARPIHPVPQKYPRKNPRGWPMSAR